MTAGRYAAGMRPAAARAARFLPIAALLLGVLLTGGRSDAGRLVDAATVGSGDTVLGDLRTPGEIDEIRVDLPRGTATSWTITKASPGSLTPAIGGFLDEAFGQVPLFSIPPSTIRSEGVPTSGLYRFLVSHSGTSLGGYRARFTARPAKSFSARGISDVAPAPLVAGAFAGATLDVTLSWKGPAPVTLTTLTGPGGTPLGGAAAPTMRGTTSSQRGFVVTTTGDQTLTFAVPAGTTRWSARIGVRTPRRTAQVHDIRADGAPEPAPFEILDAGFPWCRLFDEEGGANAWILTSAGLRPTGGPFDTRRGTCTQTPVGGTPDEATEYVLACSTGYTARLTEVVRDDAGRVTSFEARLLTDPAGTGSASYEGFEYDEAGRPVAWREVRRFAATGRSHAFAYSAVKRFGNGAVSSCMVNHTDPSGRTRTYTYGPYR